MPTRRRAASGPTAKRAFVADLLVDTDVFIDHLRGRRELIAEGHDISFSVVTRAELFAGPPAQEELARALLAPFRELEISTPIAESAGRIRRESGVLLPDALIAATALHWDLEILSGNVRDFGRIEGARLRQARG